MLMSTTHYANWHWNSVLRGEVKVYDDKRDSIQHIPWPVGTLTVTLTVKLISKLLVLVLTHMFLAAPNVKKKVSSFLLWGKTFLQQYMNFLLSGSTHRPN